MNNNNNESWFHLAHSGCSRSGDCCVLTPCQSWEKCPGSVKIGPQFPLLLCVEVLGFYLFYFFLSEFIGGWRSRWRVGVCFSVITSAHSELPVSGEATPWSSNHELKVPPGFLMPQSRVRTQAKLYKMYTNSFQKVHHQNLLQPSQVQPMLGKLNECLSMNAVGFSCPEKRDINVYGFFLIEYF